MFNDILIALYMKYLGRDMSKCKQIFALTITRVCCINSFLFLSFLLKVKAQKSHKDKFADISVKL